MSFWVQSLVAQTLGRREDHFLPTPVTLRITCQEGSPLRCHDGQAQGCRAQVWVPLPGPRLSQALGRHWPLPGHCSPKCPSLGAQPGSAPTEVSRGSPGSAYNPRSPCPGPPPHTTGSHLLLTRLGALSSATSSHTAGFP